MNKLSDFLSAAAEYARMAQPANFPSDEPAPVNSPCSGRAVARNPMAWRQRHPNASAWIDANRERSTFAQSLFDSLNRYGSLTPNQLAAVERNILSDQERGKSPRAQRVDATINGTGFEKMVEGFKRAYAAGLKRPKLRVDDLRFSLAKETSVNAGYIYVKAGEVYLGKISPRGEWSRSYDCSEVENVRVQEIARDPFGALVEYGHRTGNCGICSRPLSDPESVERGIGPVCAAKYGWL